MILINQLTAYSADQIPFDMKDLLRQEAKSHPAMKVEDLYKFLHHASFGSEHAIKDNPGVERWLEQEIKGLDMRIQDPMTVPLRPDGMLVRVNLRPYVREGFDQKVLLQAFITTANTYPGSRDDFHKFYLIALELTKEGLFGFSEKEWTRFFIRQEHKGLPAIHHSGRYTRKYKPAYRVVNLSYLTDLS